MNEVSRVKKEAEWYAPGKWPFLPGDHVLVVENETAKIGRIDCVRLHYCPTQNQGKEPDEKTLWVSLTLLMAQLVDMRSVRDLPAPVSTPCLPTSYPLSH